MRKVAFIALSVFLLVTAIVAGLALFTYYTARRVEAAVPPAGHFVGVPGARLHVVERGQGAPLVLVPGLDIAAGVFTYGGVDRLAADFHVIAVDRPGTGYSVWAPGASASLSAQADVLAALIEKLGLERPVVVGHSLGGAIALALAQRHPDRVAALALVAPLTHPVADVPAAFRGLQINQPWIRTLIAWSVATPIGLAKGDEILAAIFSPEAVPADFGTRGGNLLALRPSQFIAACADVSDLPESLPLIVRGYGAMRLPVGILFGRSDQILSPRDQGETLAAELPGAQLTIIEGGHMLPVTAPDRTAQFIRDVAARARG